MHEILEIEILSSENQWSVAATASLTDTPIIAGRAGVGGITPNYADLNCCPHFFSHKSIGHERQSSD